MFDHIGDDYTIGAFADEVDRVSDSMHRRSVLTLLGTSAVATAWPLAARAQQAGMRRVAILLAYPPTDAEWQARVQALRDELAKLGWIANRNVQFDVRWTTDNMDLVRAN